MIEDYARYFSAALKFEKSEEYPRGASDMGALHG